MPLNLRSLLAAVIILAGVLVQSCSKKTDLPPGTGDPIPGETETLKLIPDSIFREYLKANVCPNAFDKSGKLIDITHTEVKNFVGTMIIDTIDLPSPYVKSLKGIEYFSKMTKLIVKNGPIDSLVLTKTMALDTVRLLGNRDLQHVEVSGLTHMRYFNAYALPVVSLNFSNLPALEYISLSSLGRLDDLKTNNDGNLRHLMTFGLSSLKTVNTSTNPELRRLFFQYGSRIESIDVTNNRKLRQLITSFCSNLKSIDLSKNDSLRNVTLDDSNIDTIDFSHNPELISVAMLRTPLRNLSFLSNPNLVLLYLDGCYALKQVDLRAQVTFDHYFIPASKYSGMPDDQMYERFQESLISRVQTPDHSEFGKATRKGVDGATENIFGGLRLPIFLDAGAVSLTQVKMNNATKDNYSLVMSRRVLSGMQPALITVYGADKTTVLCNDYSPETFTCN